MPSVQLRYPKETLSVAVISSVSWVCCSTLIIYTCYLLFSASGSGRTRSESDSSAKRQNSRSKLRFLRTQFGVLFANLLIGDLLQSTGFGMNYAWYILDREPDNDASHICQAQGVLVQAGDLASAFWSLTIALHTSCFIVWRYKPSKKIIVALIPTTWVTIIFLTAMGPLYVLDRRNHGHQAGMFYGNAGLWCWVSLEYNHWRMWGHYLFVFLSAFTSLVAYISIFIFLWFRLFQRGAYNHTLFSLRRASDGRLMPDSPHPGGQSAEQGSNEATTQGLNQPRLRQRVRDPNADERNRKVDKAALMMLLFPASYIISILPLATYRLARASGRSWTNNREIQAVCGCIFALGGFFNAVLYVFTRKIFRNNAGESVSGPSSGPVRPSIEVMQPYSSDEAQSPMSSGEPKSPFKLVFPSGPRRESTESYQETLSSKYSRDRRGSRQSGHSQSYTLGHVGGGGGGQGQKWHNNQQPAGNLPSRPGLVRQQSGLRMSSFGPVPNRKADGTLDDGLSFEESDEDGEAEGGGSRAEGDLEKGSSSTRKERTPLLAQEEGFKDGLALIDPQRTSTFVALDVHYSNPGRRPIASEGSPVITQLEAPSSVSRP